MANTRFLRVLPVACLAILLLAAAAADARVGGSRSFGSRGSRSLSPSRPSYAPSSPSVAPSPSTAPRPTSPTAPQPAGGGFFRSFGGGLAGGLLGGMLLGSLFGGGHGAMGGCGGSGIGLLEIALLVGVGYFVVRMFSRDRGADARPAGYGGPRAVDPEPAGSSPATDWQQRYGGGAPSPDADVAGGIAAIRGYDPSFDPQRFCDDTASGIFFRVQGAYTARDISPVESLLATEVRGVIQADVDDLRARRQFNRLENISVRKVEVVEAWQESGQDYVTVLFRANLLDYVADESGTVLSGSKSDPVLFEEYWTFARPSGAGAWKLTAISQPS
jgi:predicted lipid-binding transport protein (Tim44 family)